MKKLLSVLLVVALTLTMFALTACNSSTPTTSPENTDSSTEAPTQAPAESAAATIEAPASEEPAATEATAPAENGEFTWNGKKEVWSVLPTTMAEGLVNINDAMGAKLEEQGWTYVKKDAQGDPTAQVNFIQDAIASGKVGALMVAAMSVEMLQDVVLDAMDAGIIVVYLGAEPTDYTINACVYTAYELTGYYAIEMVETWAKQFNAAPDSTGKIPVALDVYEEIADGKYRSNAFRGRTSESDTLYIYNENVTYGNDPQNGGYAWAENMMTANPDLRIFVCYEPDCMIGVVSYLERYASENGLDLADFCVVCCYVDSATQEEYKKAVADPSSTAFKGYVTYGDEGDVATYGDLASMTAVGHKLAEEIAGAADGTWPFGQTYYDTITAYATFEGYSAVWHMGDPNPATKYKDMY